MAYGAGIGWLAGAIGCTSDFTNTNDWTRKMETEKWGETPKAEFRGPKEGRIPKSQLIKP